MRRTSPASCSRSTRTWTRVTATASPSSASARASSSGTRCSTTCAWARTSGFTSPASFLGARKSIVDEAFPGDVIGLYDTGNFKIGDTLTEGEKIMFQGIPTFSPEVFKELVNLDPSKSKQLAKGIEQLTDEGVAQLFTQQQGNRQDRRHRGCAAVRRAPVPAGA